MCAQCNIPTCHCPQTALLGPCTCSCAAWPQISKGRDVCCAVQVPEVQYRAEPYRPAAAYLYTADDPQTARDIAANLFQTANLSNAAAVANATALFQAGLAEVRCRRRVVLLPEGFGGVWFHVPLSTPGLPSHGCRSKCGDLGLSPLQVPTVINGDAISEVGYVLGTSADNFRSAYLEAAFVDNLVSFLGMSRHQ